MAKLGGPRQRLGSRGSSRGGHGDKDGVGTAYAASSRVWFTIWNGILTEVYYPTADRPQIRDLQLLRPMARASSTESAPFAHGDGADRVHPGLSDHEHRSGGALHVEKEIVADPHLACVLQRVRLTGDPDFLARLQVYALCAPHLDIGGAGNSAYVLEVSGRRILAAEKGARGWHWELQCPSRGSPADTWAKRRLDGPVVRFSDGLGVRSGSRRQRGAHGRAGSRAHPGVHLGLAFGDGLHNAITALLQSLGVPFEQQQARYEEQWERADRHRLPLDQPRVTRATYTMEAVGCCWRTRTKRSRAR